jgi:hypothetical protein
MTKAEKQQIGVWWRRIQEMVMDRRMAETIGGGMGVTDGWAGTGLVVPTGEIDERSQNWREQESIYNWFTWRGDLMQDRVD